MKPLKSRLVFLGLLTSLVWTGCASGPELAKYPRREIDRPYTLPSGVANWHVPGLIGAIGDSTGGTGLVASVYPLIWEMSLSDDWNLIWMPLPLGVSHQFWNDPGSRGGFSLLTGFSYSSVNGFVLSPTLAFSYRHKFSPTLAFDLEPEFRPEIPFKSAVPFHWTAGMTLSPVFQLNETFALSPHLQLGATRGSDWSSTVAAYEQASLIPVLQEQTAFKFGLGLSATWSFGRQWDFRPRYEYSSIGTTNGYFSHLGIIEFVHFW